MLFFVPGRPTGGATRADQRIDGSHQQAAFAVSCSIISIDAHNVILLTLLYSRMPDNKEGREQKADDKERRQREQELSEELDRGNEAEPVHDDPGRRLGNFDKALANHEYPTTSDELIEIYGDQEVESRGGRKTIGEVLTPIDDETYESADEVRQRIQGLLRR